MARRIKAGIKKGQIQPVISSLSVLHRLEHTKRFTELGREEKGESKGERQIQPVISSLSVLHRLEHTKRFKELGREEKREGGDRGDLVEQKESQKGREQSSQ